MSQYTPGPWFVDKDGNIVTKNGDEVLASHGFDGDGHYMAATYADRRLAAAAPDLLAACERVVERWETHDGQMNRVDDVLAAIAKAKGETK